MFKNKIVNTEKIVFFYKMKIVGKANLPDATTRTERWNIARENGVERYDRFCFVSPKGRLRFDSEQSPLVKRGDRIRKQYWLLVELNFYKLKQK